MISVHNEPQPTDLGDVRVANRAVVLRHVRLHAPCSRADIAATTGLNKATVSSLVTELLDRRLVRETGLTENRVGRPATMLVLDGAPYAALGLQIGADDLVVVAVDLAGNRLLTWRRAFPAPTTAPAETVRALATLARRAIGRVTGQGRAVLGLTVGVPGLVDTAGGVPLASGLGWRDVPLAAELRAVLRETGFTVTVDTDANLAVLAEQRHGGYAAATDLVHLTGGVSVGAGVLAGGRLLRGHRGHAGELGHLCLDPAGPPCPCGRRGCLSALTALPAVVARLLPDTTGDGPVTDYLPELDRIVAAARQEDPFVLAGLADIGRHLGHGAAVLANLLNPEAIVVGGHFATLAPWLLPAARAELVARTLAPQAGDCRLDASRLDSAATALGGATAALAAIEAGRLPAG
ncbi:MULTISPECIES: ROK family transcriptional regulator [Micromonospora]|uniref:Sugar kinase of the NBD/HSP70 family, may contain an N-terminal HTH domain n=1 Tax=Micromonospora rifamycinica TaxID=291594 RepID=A0A120F8K6_9ACTN|nr:MULTISPECIES: ROK family transcriptional regulator [Micromonospora]KWV31969.1 ROK family transcriptional regulator [Micromonospora rifamycinica]WFE65849.1 ROK family transcriptional regulator [Micromonospora sp. WMMD714]SCG41215.1 Sugar kinase of the NBD/HSP70 family, may contain an N-terminal HTH domain [Micromonospora rifamycinica]